MCHSVSFQLSSCHDHNHVGASCHVTSQHNKSRCIISYRTTPCHLSSTSPRSTRCHSASLRSVHCHITTWCPMATADTGLHCILPHRDVAPDGHILCLSLLLSLLLLLLLLLVVVLVVCALLLPLLVVLSSYTGVEPFLTRA